MLTALREIRIGSQKVAETPVVVPSFSSKGFQDVGKIVDTLSSVITDSILLSAYDFSFDHLKKVPTYPAFIILDSGGYECSRDADLSDTRSHDYVERAWSIQQLEKVLDGWTSAQPTIAVSFDHPKERISVPDQIARAQKLFNGRELGREILIKPSSNMATRIDLNEVIGCVYDLRHFDVIGFTEAELGFSLFDRMQKIAKIRRALDAAGIDKPIHIFGSLDTLSTPLYFLSGADIFDGLTWLRYSYVNGHAVYRKNAGALKYGIRINDDDVDPRIWFENYQELQNLEISMRRFVKEGGKFETFKHHSELLRQSHGELLAKL